MVKKLKCWVLKKTAKERQYYEHKNKDLIASAEKVGKHWFTVVGTSKNQKSVGVSTKSKKSALNKAKSFMKKHDRC
ncbi:MAG: hypothetical protein Q7R52_03055 [archaeon]|nr:hypothetical protein [archaeon]